MEWDFEAGLMFCGGPAMTLRAYCHPDNFKGATNILFHQRADGTFEDVSRAPGIADPTGKDSVLLSPTLTTTDMDVFVANDSVRQSLYRNKRDGSFEDVAISGAAYDENGELSLGWALTVLDYDNDGYIDVFITTLSNEKYALYRNNGDLSFSYVTNFCGRTNHSPLFRMGTRFVDVDNDGWRDLFVAQGHVLDTVESHRLPEISATASFDP